VWKLEENMKKKSLVLIILIAIITIPLTYSKCNFDNGFEKSIVINKKKMIETSSNVIDSNEIIYTSDKSIDLAKGATINLELSLEDIEVKTPCSLTICLMKVDANINKDGVISLIGSLDDLNTYSKVLSYKTLTIEKTLTTTFDVSSDGKYIIFVLDEHKIVNPSNLDVKCEFTIGDDNEKGESGIIGL
jgi:hypothetical protein